MAKVDVYKSRYKFFTFYSAGKRKQFYNYHYKTDNPIDKKVLNKIKDVKLVTEAKPSKPAKPEPEEKPETGQTVTTTDTNYTGMGKGNNNTSTKQQ